MRYKAFISYRASERAWAERLFASLCEKGLRPEQLFLDTARLQAGEPWSAQLNTALDESEHIIVLWSQLAADPDSYVNEERKYFEVYHHLPSTKDPDLPRKMIFVLLNRNPPPTARVLHAITDIHDNALFDRGAGAIPDPIWSGVVDKVHEALDKQDPAILVSCVILASTKPRLTALDFDAPLGDLKSLGATIAAYGLTRADFIDRYGEDPCDWRPFGASQSVKVVMKALGEGVNSTLMGSPDPGFSKLRIRWEFPRPAYWSSSHDEAKSETLRWRSRPVVVVLDPLSIYDLRVAQRLRLVADTLTSDLLTFMVLGITAAAETRRLVRSILSAEAVRLHQLFCEPGLPLSGPQPVGSANVDDETDMRRYLVTAIGNYATRLTPRAARQEAAIISPRGLR